MLKNNTCVSIPVTNFKLNAQSDLFWIQTLFIWIVFARMVNNHGDEKQFNSGILLNYGTHRIILECINLNKIKT